MEFKKRLGFLRVRAAFFTLGCKVNQYETGALERQFAENGFTVVPPHEQADVYIINSCTVTADGDRKSRQMLRRFRRQNPLAVTVLCGCFPQAFPEEAAALAEADIVAGTKNRAQLLELVRAKLSGAERTVCVVPHASGEPFEALRLGAPGTRTRAFVKIEDGCERHCSYCIIPTARGPVRSRSMDDIRAELLSLTQAGFHEIVLVGVNLSSYGLDIGLRLLDAVQLACSLCGRVRLGSLEPELLSPEDIAGLARLPNFCPQFHLSLQSGCDATLRRMARPYDTAAYRRIVQNLRAAFPGCAVTTDIMVGFPGETGEEFERSLAFVEETGFARIHVFSYSGRPGTPAAEMPGQVPNAVKAARSRQMLAAAAQSTREFLQAQVTQTVRVLFETQTSPGIWEGYSEAYCPVRVNSDEALSGLVLPVRITGVEDAYCIGELACEEAG